MPKAADIINAKVGGVPLDGNLSAFISSAEQWLLDNDIAFYKSKEETEKEGNRFWHISLYGENSEQRRKFTPPKKNKCLMKVEIVKCENQKCFKEFAVGYKRGIFGSWTWIRPKRTIIGLH